MVQGLPLSANSLFSILTILSPSTSTGLHDDLSPRDFPAPCHFLRRYPSCMLASSSRSSHCFHRLPLYHSAPTRSRFVCLLSLVQGPLPRACLYKISHALTSAPATPPHQRRRAGPIVRSRDSDLIVDRLRRILCLYKVSSSHLWRIHTSVSRPSQPAPQICKCAHSVLNASRADRELQAASSLDSLGARPTSVALHCTAAVSGVQKANELCLVHLSHILHSPHHGSWSG